MGRDEGVSEQQIDAVHDYENADVFDETERLVLRYADAMADTPVEVPAELFDALQKRFEPRQLVELTSAIAWENYRARFDHAFGLGAEGFSEGAACARPVA